MGFRNSVRQGYSFIYSFAKQAKSISSGGPARIGEDYGAEESNSALKRGPFWLVESRNSWIFGSRARVKT